MDHIFLNFEYLIKHPQYVITKGGDNKWKNSSSNHTQRMDMNPRLLKQPKRILER